MEQAENIRIEDFNYELPNGKIAKYPLKERDSSKLLIWKNNRISETTFNCISEYIPENALLVFNNTKVIPARMIFPKETGAQIEIFCLEPKEPTDYAQIFSQTRSCSWLCLVGNSKRWKSGKLTKQISSEKKIICSVEKIADYGKTHWIRFEWNPPDLCFTDVLEQLGELPIPPYLNRKTEESDKEAYQTVYSKIKGSVAAPTAGLHFTQKVFDSLKKRNIEWEELTLHVGIGTFKPVQSKTLAGHEMHSEYFSITKTTIKKIMEKEGSVFAVGTTSVRTLESLYYIGMLIENHPDAAPDELSISQQIPYFTNYPPISVSHSLENILSYLERKNLQTLVTHTQILIAPGYVFKIVNGMITNFHQPKSTLLLLVSAFVEGQWKKIYDYAQNHNFRFLSYGDSSLLIRSVNGET